MTSRSDRTCRYREGTSPQPALWFFFGAYALMSYPDIAQNAQDFSTYCNLEKEVLKAPVGTKPL
jgi:hypothetical protein